MRYTGETCPYCGNEFTETDDIVVCPVCATPHHRSCWFAHGDCANAARHGEGFIWQKIVQSEQEPEQEKKEEQTKGKNLDIICPECGKVCPNGTLRCPDCGAILVPQFTQDGMPPLASFRPEFNPNEEIDEMKAGDIAIYCRTAGNRYIHFFNKMAHGRKIVWNWAAFIFTPYWYFYRKMYKVGIVFFSLLVAINLWMTPYSQAAYDVYQSVMIEAQEAAEEFKDDEAAAQNASSQVINKRMDEMMAAARPMAAPTACTLLLNIVSAMIANTLYRKKMRADIKKIRSEQNDDRAVQAELFRKGGVSLLFGLGTYIGFDVILRLAYFFLDK